MGQKKARDVQAPHLVRSSVTTADHPVGLTGPTGGEVAPTVVNQSSNVRTPTEVADKGESNRISQIYLSAQKACKIESVIHELRIILVFSWTQKVSWVALTIATVCLNGSH